MRIFALFDDPDAIQKARDALEKQGRGDEVVRIVSPHLDDDAGSPVAPVMGSGQSISGPAVVNQTGRTAPGGAPLADAVTSLGRLRLPDDVADAFAQALRHEDAQVLVLDTPDDDAEATKAMLDEYGAELVATR